MKESLVITDNVFAFYLADTSEYSYFDVGAIDETALLEEGTLEY